MIDLNNNPHRRFNPLTGEYVLVSPHRAQRPWSGQVEPDAESARRDAWAADCPLCPGNERAGGILNPRYSGPFVFDNDFAALLPGAVPDAIDDSESELFRTQAVAGTTRVICYSEDHARGLAELPVATISDLVNTWREQVNELGRSWAWVQLFENRGAMMGSSQPHPHGQIWASSFLPNEITRRQARLETWQQSHGSNLLIDYLDAELDRQERIIFETDHWVALVPYWAAWPFETMLLPRRHRQDFESLDAAEAEDLAVALKKLATRYDNLFRCEFPWSMGWYFAPPAESGSPRNAWQLHAVFYPPLLRSATVKKFMVGYEMLAEVQRDITPEQAAAQLRAQSDVHFREA